MTDKREDSMTEEEMRNADVPWFETEAELIEYINKLANQTQDYGTCVYAMSMSAVAALQYVGKKLGVTGFQASCADLDILRRTRHMEVFGIQDYADMLFPQYENKFDKTISAGVWKWLQEKAQENLKDREAVPAVMNHWQSIADGKIPFGYVLDREGGEGV